MRKKRLYRVPVLLKKPVNWLGGAQVAPGKTLINVSYRPHLSGDLIYSMSPASAVALRGTGTIYAYNGSQYVAVADPSVPAYVSYGPTPQKSVGGLTIKPIYPMWKEGVMPVAGDIWAHNSIVGDTRLLHCKTATALLAKPWDLSRPARAGAEITDSVGNVWVTGEEYSDFEGALIEPETTQTAVNPANLMDAAWTIQGGATRQAGSSSIIQGYTSTIVTGTHVTDDEIRQTITTGVSTDPITVCAIFRRVPGSTQSFSRINYNGHSVLLRIEWDTGQLVEENGSGFEARWIGDGWIECHIYGVSDGTNRELRIRPSAGSYGEVEIAYLGAWTEHRRCQPIPEQATRPADPRHETNITRQKFQDSAANIGQVLWLGHGMHDGQRGLWQTINFYDSVASLYRTGSQHQLRCWHTASSRPVTLADTADQGSYVYAGSIEWNAPNVWAKGYEQHGTYLESTAADFTSHKYSDLTAPVRYGQTNNAPNSKPVAFRALACWSEVKIDFEAELGPDAIYKGQPLPPLSPPVLVVTNDSATSSSITVTFTTDEDCSVVLDAGAGGTDTSASGFEHTLTVSSLTAETDYSWTLTATSNITSLTAQTTGNTTTTPVGGPALEITNVSVTPTDTGVTVTCDTNELASGEFRITTPNLGVEDTTSATTSHMFVNTTTLTPSTAYDYVITCEEDGDPDNWDTHTGSFSTLGDAGMDPTLTETSIQVASGVRDFTVNPPAGSIEGDYCVVIVQSAHNNQPNSYPAGLTLLDYQNSGANGISVMEGAVQAGGAGWDFGHQYTIAWQSAVVCNPGATKATGVTSWATGSSSDAPVTIEGGNVPVGAAGIPIAIWTSDRNTMQGRAENQATWSTDNSDTVNVRWHNNSSSSANEQSTGGTGNPSMNVSYREVVLGEGDPTGNITFTSSLGGRNSGEFIFSLQE